MAAFLDGCRFNPVAGGTTDWTYSSAVTGYQSPAAANVVNETLYKYRAESADLSQWEFGEGAYNTGTGVLARTTVLYNSAGNSSKINFSTVPQVAIVALKEDIISVQENNSFSAAQQAQARHNIGTSIGIPDVIVEEQYANGTRPTGPTAAGTYTRNLNTITHNALGIAAPSSGQITLPAGTYFAKWSCPGFAIQFYQSKLQNITSGTMIAPGQSVACAPSSGVGDCSEGSCVFTLTVSSVIALQHVMSSTTGTLGFGRPGSLGITEVFARLEIQQLS
jgi:hypothetical protein